MKSQVIPWKAPNIAVMKYYLDLEIFSHSKIISCYLNHLANIYTKLNISASIIRREQLVNTKSWPYTEDKTSPWKKNNLLYPQMTCWMGRKDIENIQTQSRRTTKNNFACRYCKTLLMINIKVSYLLLLTLFV